jgi:hypothetical protein
MEVTLRAAGSKLGLLLLQVGVFVQLCHFAYFPRMAVPSEAARQAWDRFAKRVHDLEVESPQADVWVLGHSQIGARRHAHSMAVEDFGRASPLPEDLVDDLRRRRFSAIVADWPSTMGEDWNTRGNQELVDAIIDGYYPDEPLEPLSLVVGAGARPRWIFRPREATLTGLAPDGRARRLEGERLAAEAKWQAKQAALFAPIADHNER